MQNLARGLLGVGTQGVVIDVECRLSNNLPTIIIIGSANKTVSEAKDRLRSAFASSKLALPRKRITLNLAPADITKNDPSLDLAMAMSILQADGKITEHPPLTTAAVGELGLDGSVRPVRGLIGKLLSSRRLGIQACFIPQQNLKQAQLVPDILLYPVESLNQLYCHLAGIKAIRPVATGDGIMKALPTLKAADDPFAHIAGQEQAKRGLLIAAAGGHNLLLHGPPGTGKSMLAKTLCSLLPPPTREEMLEITQIASLANHNYNQLITRRPFRQPHHTASLKAIVGGGVSQRPGEISLSHRGVLLLDEIPEFSRQILESLRQPLENRYVDIARAKDSIRLPANFILVATANPCPCGYNGSGLARCTCSPGALNRYKNQLSGPIIDRIDLVCTMQPVQHKQLLVAATSSTSDARAKIARARKLQAGRNGPQLPNSDLSNALLRKHAQLAPEARNFLDRAAGRLDISARAYMRIIKVARTIADLDDSKDIQQPHIGEALMYRQRPT